MWNVNVRLMESDTFVFNKRLTSCFWELSCLGTYVYHVYTYIIYIVWKMIKVPQQIFRDRLITFALPCKESKKLQERLNFQSPQLNFQSHFIPMFLCSSPLSLQICCWGRDVSSFILSGKSGNRPCSGESEEGALGWVSGGRRHLTTTQPWSPGFSEQKGKN